MIRLTNANALPNMALIGSKLDSSSKIEQDHASSAALAQSSTMLPLERTYGLADLPDDDTFEPISAEQRCSRLCVRGIDDLLEPRNHEALSAFVSYLDVCDALPLIQFWLETDSFSKAGRTRADYIGILRQYEAVDETEAVPNGCVEASSVSSVSFHRSESPSMRNFHNGS